MFVYYYTSARLFIYAHNKEKAKKKENKTMFVILFTI